nr:MAG TPA_asm: hypothetical protein [Caudoviricetes sp.]
MSPRRILIRSSDINLTPFTGHKQQDELGSSASVTSSGGELHKALRVTQNETNLNFGSDCEHVALPQVNLLTATGNRTTVVNINLDILNRTPHSRRPLASKTGNLRAFKGASGGHRLTQNGSDLANGGIVRNQQRTVHRIRNVESINASFLGESPTINNTLIRSNRLHARQERLNGAIKRNLRRILQRVETSARRVLNTQRGFIELAAKCVWEAANQLCVQARKVTAELIREQLNDRHLVRSHYLGTKLGIRDRLLVSFINPAGLRVAGNHRDSKTTSRQRDLTGTCLHSGIFEGVSPNLRRNLGGELNDSGSAAINIDSHRYLLSKSSVNLVIEKRPNSLSELVTSRTTRHTHLPRFRNWLWATSREHCLRNLLELLGTLHERILIAITEEASHLSR